MAHLRDTTDGAKLRCAVALIQLASESDESRDARLDYLRDAVRRIEAVIASPTTDGPPRFRAETFRRPNPNSSMFPMLREPKPAPRFKKIAEPVPMPDASDRIPIVEPAPVRPAPASSHVARFLENQCVFDKGKTIAVDLLYDSYQRIYHDPLTVDDFCRQVIEIGDNVRESPIGMGDYRMILLEGISLKQQAFIDLAPENDDSLIPAGLVGGYVRQLSRGLPPSEIPR